MRQPDKFPDEEQTPALADEKEELLMRLAALGEKVKFFEQENSWLREQLNSMKRAKYGKKSEAWESQEQVKMTFNEAEVEAANAADAENDEAGEGSEVEGSEVEDQNHSESETRAPNAVEVAGYQRKSRGHRKALPESLPREIVRIELPEDELISECGERLKVIGWEVSEKLKYQPAKMSVIEYRRAKYGVDAGDYIKTAPPEASVIPKGIATAELLAAIIVGKYADGLPLYRLEEIFARQNIELGRGTMGRWLVQVAEALMPIRNVLSDRLFLSYAVACDETSMQVLKEDGRPAEAKSWMIVRLNPVEERKIVLFDYSISRSGKTMSDLFAGYQGRLLCDGLEVYSRLESPEVNRFGCNMHGRRKFEQAAKDGANAGKSVARKVMDIYKKIYHYESLLSGVTPERKTTQREKFQRPLFEAIKTIVDDHRPKVPPKSKLGEALTYFTNEFVYLTKYLSDGYLDPDNGLVERTIRKFAIGRNNWLFADTPKGAEASALLYSIVITAKLNGVNPYLALVEILKQIPKAQSVDDYERLAELILSRGPSLAT
jgi:transposase